MKTFVAALTLMAPLLALAASTPEEDRDDIREAVFRHQFHKNASGLQQGARVYCLSLEGKIDPAASFLSRFSDVKTPVRAASSCTASAEDGVRDKVTHQRGLVLRVDKVTLEDATHATVEGGYYEAGLSASGNTYTVERKNGKWIVTGDHTKWIS